MEFFLDIRFFKHLASYDVVCNYFMRAVCHYHALVVSTISQKYYGVLRQRRIINFSVIQLYL